MRKTPRERRLLYVVIGGAVLLSIAVGMTLLSVADVHGDWLTYATVLVYFVLMLVGFYAAKLTRWQR